MLIVSALAINSIICRVLFQPMHTQNSHNVFYVAYISLIVALGGFLMGFDASVISGVNKFITLEFNLSELELGWAVSSLTLTATLAMMISGPLADKLGRKPVLMIAALLFLISAVLSAFAPNFITLILARMIGGLGVGAALIIAPMYIAEIAPAHLRGRLVSFNQLNIVIGITVAFFSNYLILQWSQEQQAWQQALQFAEHNWRWMLGVEAIPAVLYLVALLFVPESPRWLLLKGEQQKAKNVLLNTASEEAVDAAIVEINQSIHHDKAKAKGAIRDLLNPSLRFVLLIGISIAVLQQITGINAVFFYAPMIFEQSGFGTDASFMQAILVGIINLVFTILAISLIDKIGRKALLIVGVGGIALCMATLAYQFGAATYQLSIEDAQQILVSSPSLQQLPLIGQVFSDDVSFKAALVAQLGADIASQHESSLIAAAINLNQQVVLVGLLGFVACFAVSLGPVMWVLFSELFPNKVRGIAISFVGLINSAISFLVQFIFPWELATLGASTTFALYSLFATLGLMIVIRYLPETKGRSLEELEVELAR